jgi:hypothetical protein
MEKCADVGTEVGGLGCQREKTNTLGILLTHVVEHGYYIRRWLTSPRVMICGRLRGSEHLRADHLIVIKYELLLTCVRYIIYCDKVLVLTIASRDFNSNFGSASVVAGWEAQFFAPISSN